MDILEIILLVYSFLVSIMTAFFKLRTEWEKKKPRLIDAPKDIGKLFTDEELLTKLKEYIIETEKINLELKEKHLATLNGDEKQNSVIQKLTDYLSDVTGNVSQAINLVEKNKDTIKRMIDFLVSITNGFKK